MVTTSTSGSTLTYNGSTGWATTTTNSPSVEVNLTLKIKGTDELDALYSLLRYISTSTKFEISSYDVDKKNS